MYLFIDTLSEPTYICLFDSDRKIIASHSWAGKQKEFDTLSDEIERILSENSLAYSELSGIVTIIGPGSFTGTRVTTLVVNALSYGFHIPLFPLTIPEFFDYQEAPLPWVIAITKREVLLWKNKETSEITQISELPKDTYSTIALIDFDSSKHTMNMSKKYSRVIATLPLSKPQTRIQPLYAKDPNITIKKSNDSQR